jgi:hypothetical protein
MDRLGDDHSKFILPQQWLLSESCGTRRNLARKCSAAIKPPGGVGARSDPAEAAITEYQALLSRGMTLTVAKRARAPIIELRYGLPWYFAR